VFSRPDFIAKSKLSCRSTSTATTMAPRSGAKSFIYRVYPTLIVLDADRHEIIRLGAGRDVAQYAAALDVALENVQPVDALLKSVTAAGALTLQECRRLAYNSWSSIRSRQTAMARRQTRWRLPPATVRPMRCWSVPR